MGRIGNIKKRWKYGIWSAVVTVLGIVLAVALVLVSDRLTDRFGWSVDLTANGRYAISDESVSWLEQLDQDVKITVLVSEEDMSSGSYYIVQAYQNLLDYERHSDHVTLEFVDVTENPALSPSIRTWNSVPMILSWNPGTGRKCFPSRTRMTTTVREAR